MSEQRRIYVACLSSYNAGTLHGRWIDATLGAEHIREEAQAMLAESKFEPHEEWAIHDYEGFGSIKLSEYESLDKVAEWAEALEEHGEAYGAYVAWIGDGATVEDFQDKYRGTFKSLKDYIEDFIEDCYGEEIAKLPDILKYNIDYDGIAHDFECGGDVYSVDGGDGVFVFDAH